MAGIDTSRTFRPLGIAVLTLTDTRTFETDTSGAYLVEALQGAGHRLAHRALIPDDKARLAECLRAWASDPSVDVVLTTGGTGITRRDITPEVVTELADKLIPGFGELFRMLSYETIGTSTIQSRALAAVVQGTLVFALPGSTGACKDAWKGILSLQLDSRHRPCNFAELLDRL